MKATARLWTLLRSDARRWPLLGVVRALDLPDCWVGAGFVRNAVWDHFHHRPPSAPAGDVDVIWFDPGQADPAADKAQEARLRRMEPAIRWSVKNQARMHLRNGDAPYGSAVDAMRHWPETATAVAVRRNDRDECEIAAPFGLEDLMGLILRPTPLFVHDRRSLYQERLRAKAWTSSWPLLREADGPR